MNRKRLLMILALFVILTAGCTPVKAVSGPAATNAPSNGENEVIPVSASGSTAPPVAANIKLDKIKGDIKNVYYADGSQVLILADKLYLYDLSSGTVAAETSLQASDGILFHTVKNGFVAVGSKINTGNGSGGLMAIDTGMEYSAVFYDRKLNKQSEFRFGELLKDNEDILSLEAIAISADGTQAAYATLNGLYLYDFLTKQKTTVVDLNGEDLKARSGVAVFEQIGFAGDDKTLAFKAQSFDIPAVPDKPSFDTCGTVNTDGSGLSNRTFDNYTCKELTAYNKQLILAEDFTIPSGRVLVMDIPGGKTKMHKLTEKRESGFVSGSDSGRYFATTVSDKTGWKIRVYETGSGKLQAEQRISGDGEELYMANHPIVKIIDKTKTYIVLVGAKQAEIKTKVEVGRF
ncbi:transcriptional regulator [Paenibacillus sp. MSJ-34]|uniref:transcriptional regulator n=1 Tax=Paenibacillus sp. MSJ-34 TaxID=2841529 RepID=UPI001C0F9B15|nr:transcriptional regulator [Paenibacillus sp. MSJ-34]MBU5441516.1 transcriptional regulator [Paenibacillus sp. MSJ-34]